MTGFDFVISSIHSHALVNLALETVESEEINVKYKITEPQF